MPDSPSIMERLAAISASEPRYGQRKGIGGRPFREEFQYIVLAFLVSRSVDLWDSIRYTSQTLLEVFFKSTNDALGYTWRFADVRSGNEKLAWVVSALICGDDLVDFLVPRLDYLGTFRVKSLVPLAGHELEYTLLACIPD